MVELFYTTYISVDLAHHEVFHAKVGKGGINCANFPIMQRIDEQVWNQSKHNMFSLLSIEQAAAEVACHNLCNILCTAF